LSTAHHAATDGVAENKNKALIRYLTLIGERTQERWPSMLSTAALAYNSAFNETLRMSPLEARFGLTPRVFPFVFDGSGQRHEVIESASEDEIGSEEQTGSTQRHAVETHEAAKGHRSVFERLGERTAPATGAQRASEGTEAPAQDPEALVEREPRLGRAEDAGQVGLNAVVTRRAAAARQLGEVGGEDPGMLPTAADARKLRAEASAQLLGESARGTRYRHQTRAEADNTAAARQLGEAGGEDPGMSPTTADARKLRAEASVQLLSESARGTRYRRQTRAEADESTPGALDDELTTVGSTSVDEVAWEAGKSTRKRKSQLHRAEVQTAQKAPAAAQKETDHLPEALRTLSELQQIAWQCARDAQITSADAAIRAHGHRVPRQLKRGDFVMVAARVLLAKSKQPQYRKVANRYLGPYEVLDAGRKTVKVKLPDTARHHNVIHIEHVKPFLNTDEFATRPSPPSDDQEILLDFVVESILKHRRRKRELQFQVKWLGYPDSQATWEPLSSFRGPDNEVENTVVRDYIAQHGVDI